MEFESEQTSQTNDTILPAESSCVANGMEYAEVGGANSIAVEVETDALELDPMAHDDNEVDQLADAAIETSAMLEADNQNTFAEGNEPSDSQIVENAQNEEQIDTNTNLVEERMSTEVHNQDSNQNSLKSEAADEDMADNAMPVETQQKTEVDEEGNEILEILPDANVVEHSAVKKEETVDENQCRVCTAKDDLVNLFDKVNKTTPADMLMAICPSVFIAPKDYMPQFICNNCLDNVTIALQLKNQLESTERELRKKLSRGKNKVRRPKGFVVIDAPDSEPPSDEEPNDDVEFKVSDVEISSTDTDSDDSAVSGKKRRTSRGASSQRGRRKGPSKSVGRVIKREFGSESDDVHEDNSTQKKRTTATSQTKRYHEDLICEACGKQFKIRGAYLTHRGKHISCGKCDRVFKNRTDLQRHMRHGHGQSNDPFDKNSMVAHRFSAKVQQRQHQKPVKNDYVTIATGTDLFKSVAPLTTTYWSDSFSD